MYNYCKITIIIIEQGQPGSNQHCPYTYSENYVILASATLLQYTYVADDRQTATTDNIS